MQIENPYAIEHLDRPVHCHTVRPNSHEFVKDHLEREGIVAELEVAEPYLKQSRDPYRMSISGDVANHSETRRGVIASHPETALEYPYNV